MKTAWGVAKIEAGVKYFRRLEAADKAMKALKKKSGGLSGKPGLLYQRFRPERELQRISSRKEKGALIFLLGEPVRHAGIVLDGAAELSFLDEGDNSVNAPRLYRKKRPHALPPVVTLISNRN